MEDVILSVIIPVYNTEKYFKECIDTVLKALKKLELKSEVLVVNDGSPGNIDEIIKEYSKKDIIKYYKKENTGLGDTRNFSLNKSLGKYITFVDSDDYIDEDYYLDVLSKMISNGADIMICDFETIDEINNTRYRVEAKNKDISNVKWGCIDIPIMPSSCNKIIKRELFDGITYPKGYKYEDLGTTLILILKAKNVLYIPNMYYKYRIINSSIMHVEFNKRNFDMIKIFDILFDRIDKLEKDSQITCKEKDLAKYMVYTRRIYEDLLEPLVYMKFSKRFEFCKILCTQIKKINKEMLNNIYFKEAVFKNQSKVKIFGNKLLHKILNTNRAFLLSMILNKKLYYRFFSVTYMSIKGVNIND